MTPPIDLRADHLRIVRDVLRQHLPTGVQVWVFGSRATWATKDSSDLDLALESAGEIPPRIVLALETAFEDSDLPFAVDVVDFARIPERFRRIVERERVPWASSLRPDEVGGPAASGDLYRPTFPAHWARRRLYSMARWVNGLAFRNIEFSDTGKPIIKIAEIKGGISDQTRFTRRTFDDSVRVLSGDLLFSWSGQPETSIDAFWWRGPEGWLNQHVFRVTPVDGIDKHFLYCLLRYLNPYFVAIAKNKQTTGLGHVTKRDLQRIEAAVPAICEQRAIAHILGTLDDKIELNRRMNATLEAMARALFKSWFVDFDPVRAKMEGRDTGLPTEIADLFPDRLVDSESGEVPIGWDTGVLAETVEILSGGTPRTSVNRYWNGDIPWYTPRDAPAPSDVFVVVTEKAITQAGVDNSSTTVLPAGTTVISARGTVGRLACLGVPMAMNQTCYGIRGADAYQSQDYFVYGLVRGTVEELRSRTHGTVFDTITRQTFASVNVPLPPVSVVKEFELAVSPIMGRILGHLHQIGVLTALRDTLLPELVSGKLRLPGQQRPIMDA